MHTGRIDAAVSAPGCFLQAQVSKLIQSVSAVDKNRCFSEKLVPAFVLMPGT